MIDIPGYETSRLLGKGGQAEVYLAKQLSFDRHVAIKVIRSNIPLHSPDVENFLKEARTVANLNHPHIIPVYDFGEKDGWLYLVMEYCTGGDLKSLIKSGILENEALKIMEQISAALAFSHHRGVYHLDIKPENIMFREDNSAILMDFGIARKKAAETPQDQEKLLGTPQYMSPEQLLSEETDGRADIYALGIVFYEMLTGTLPYDDENIIELAKKHLNSPIPQLPLEYKKYQHIFEKMLAKDPSDRYQTILEVAKVFNRISSNTYTQSQTSKQASTVQSRQDVSGKGLPKRFISQEDLEFIQNFHPLIDPDWKQQLKSIFLQLNDQKRKYVYERILLPKNICYDSAKRRFFYDGFLNIKALAANIAAPALRMIAEKLQHGLSELDAMHDAAGIADIMESSLEMIDSFDCQENMALQKEKTLLRDTYINELIQFTNSVELEIPKTQRKLNGTAVKTFILEVFLRHQILGYRFRSYPLAQLREDPDPFLSSTIAREAEIRQCELIRTDEYLFLIGAVKNISQNPFSIRRFLAEESVMNGQHIFFNAIAIPLSDIDSKKCRDQVEWEISRIFTLERQLSPGVLDFVKDIQKAQEEKLRPMFKEKISSDGTRIEAIIEYRLFYYEKELTISILKKFTTCVLMLSKTRDDLDFLFISLRRLLVEIAGDIRDFHMNPALSWSQAVENLELKVIAYMDLLEKRHDQIFVLKSDERPDDPLLDPRNPIEEFKRNTKEGMQKLAEATANLKHALERQEKEKESLLYRMAMKATSITGNQKTPEQLEQEILRVRHECLVGFIRICKRYSKIVIYLEFEGLVELDESKRHYALPFGEAGISHLPSLITLYEDPGLLDLDAILKALSFDVLHDFPTTVETTRMGSG